MDGCVANWQESPGPRGPRSVLRSKNLLRNQENTRLNTISNYTYVCIGNQIELSTYYLVEKYCSLSTLRKIVPVSVSTIPQNV